MTNQYESLNSAFYKNRLLYDALICLSVLADKSISGVGAKPNRTILTTNKLAANISGSRKSSIDCMAGLTVPVNNKPMVRIA